MVVVSKTRARRRTAKRQRRRDRPLVKPAAKAMINIGAPDSDTFTHTVFDQRLKKATPKLTIASQGMDDLRREVMKFVDANVNGKNNSLDIIADAPGGIQIIFQSPLLRIVLDSTSGVDDELVALIKDRFSQFRLLGCVTGVDGEVWKNAHNLANRLQMPAVGTLRAISYGDFDDKSFKDKQANGQRIVTVIDPDSTDSPESVAQRLALAAQVQTGWLHSFPQVQVVRDDILELPVPGWPWAVRDEVVGSTVATTDAIRTFVDGVVTLQTPSGASFKAEVLARGTLLRLRSRRYGQLYLNVPANSPERREWLLHAPKPWPPIPDAI